jgi:hypothetical protein
MIDNDNDGERELVLGNKQLLGIFFVATLLCGVFFAMGYVVGGNSAKSNAAAAAADNAATPVSEGKREEPQASQSSALQTSTETASNSLSGAPGDTGSPFPAAEPKVTDNPAAAGAQPPVVPAPAPVQAAPIPPAPVPTAAKTAPASVTAPADTGIVVSVPERATRYWQVTAEPRPDADTLVKSLRDRHLPAILAASPNPKLFEVLVGPYRSDVALADAKKRLADIGGFDGLFVKKF